MTILQGSATGSVGAAPRPDGSGDAQALKSEGLPSRAHDVALQKQDFLELLVAQIRNQDPMEPQGSEQFMQQLTQFSMLEQMMNLNEGMETLALGQLSSNHQQALEFVGKEILAAGDTVDFTPGSPAQITYQAGEGADELAVEILDADGNLIATRTLADSAQGVFDWDGTNDDGVAQPAGTYRFRISGETDDGDPVPIDTQVRGRVTGVRFDNGYPELMVGDRRLTLGDVVQVKNEP